MIILFVFSLRITRTETVNNVRRRNGRHSILWKYSVPKVSLNEVLLTNDPLLFDQTSYILVKLNVKVVFTWQWHKIPISNQPWIGCYARTCGNPARVPRPPPNSAKTVSGMWRSPGCFQRARWFLRWKGTSLVWVALGSSPTNYLNAVSKNVFPGKPQAKWCIL